MTSQRIRQRFDVVAIADKVRETRLYWVGHDFCATVPKIFAFAPSFSCLREMSKEGVKSFLAPENNE